MKVLIVDSDAGAREQAAVILGGFGFTVLHAATGADAARLLRQEDRLTLLLAAARLNDAAGCDLAALAVGLHPGIKVLLSDTFGGDAEREGYPVLCKPYRFGAFIRQIREQLLPA